MAVCQFFLKGQCKFGDNCRNEHPANARQSGFGASSWNRGGNDDQKLNFPFSAASISNDLTPHIDKPIWPLSSYAPSKHEPLLVPGLDESPEELRVKAASAVASGNINAYLEYEGRQIAAADQTFANARNHSTQAYDQAVKQSEIPARLAAAASNTQTATSAFGNNTNSTSTLPSAFANTNPTTSTFGQSAFGQPTFGQSAFGQPAFGQPVQNPSTSATSTAPTQTNAFGQPLNNPAPATAFGQPPPATSSTPNQTGAFGQPLNNPAPVSAFGQTPPATSSVFGQPSALGTSSFIKPASGAFSAFNNTESAFGNNITTPATNTGGGGFSAFATQPSAFSLAAKTTSPTAGSTFGQPSFGQPAPAPFAPATSVSVFGNPAPAPTSVFGTSSAFGVPSQPQQPGQQEQQQQQQIAAPIWPSNNNPSSNTTPHYNSTFGTTPTTQTIPPTTTKSSRTKSVFKPGSTPYDQQIPSNYKETLPKSVVQAFEDQNFEWGDVPEWVPPVEVR